MLTLPIKKKWFDMIKNGEKVEEYRAFTEYYQTRLRNVWGYPAYWHEIHEVILKNGYAADAPKLLIKASLAVRTGRKEWGAKPNEKYFVLIIHSVSEPVEEIKNIFYTQKNITIWKLLWRREEWTTQE